MTNTKMISSEIYKGVYDSLIKEKKNSIYDDTSSTNWQK